MVEKRTHSRHTRIVDFGLFIASILFTLSTPGSGARRVRFALFGHVLNQRSRLCPRSSCRVARFTIEEMGQQGDPLVFLSGLGGDHRAFSRPQRHFGARFRALAFDARDAGQSDRVGSSVHDGRHGRRCGRLARGDRGGSRPRRGPIVGRPGRPGIGLAPSGAGEEPGPGLDPRRRRRLAQGGDRIMGVAATPGRDRRIHTGGPSLVDRTPVLSPAGPGRGADPVRRAEPVAARSRGVCPPGTRGHRTRHARSASDRFRSRAWSWSASSTW